MPKVSVVMASYHHAPFVAEAIRSALSQEGVDVELVITDDGSRDDTVAQIEAIRDPRIRLHVLPSNQGACVALNDAIRRARGEYVAVLNSDDAFLPGKLARQVALLDARPNLAAVFGLPQFVDERGRPFANPRHAMVSLFTAQNQDRIGWLRRFLYEGNCLCHPTLMIRRSCYQRIGLLDPLLMQLPDLDLWVRLCSVEEIEVLPEPLTAFRILDRERNTSAPSKERLARVAWETPTILRHYLQLPPNELNAVLADEPPENRGPSARVTLALAALRLSKPGYSAFGLQLLQDCLREDPAIMPAPEYFRRAGAADPYGAEYYGREYQLVRRSRLVRFARRAWTWMRARNRA